MAKQLLEKVPYSYWAIVDSDNKILRFNYDVFSELQPISYTPNKKPNLMVFDSKVEAGRAIQNLTFSGLSVKRIKFHVMEIV